MFRKTMEIVTGLRIDPATRIVRMDNTGTGGAGAAGGAGGAGAAGSSVGGKLDAAAQDIADIAAAQAKFAASTAGSTAEINASAKIGQAAQGAGR